MCLLTMANDGGLRAVLDTSDTVSFELLALGRAKNQRSCRDEDIHDLAMHTATVLEVNDDSVRSGTKRHASRSLSELSSDLSPKKMNLSLNTSQELKRVVTPLIEKMQSIDAAALLSLNPSSQSAGARLDEKGSLTVPPIHDRITPSYADDGSDIVRYLHVKEVPCKYSVGIFVFPPNTEIPLHDHPDMVVISRVLYGELKVRSYDVLSPGYDVPKDRSNEKSSTSNNGTKEAQAAHGRQSVFTSSLKAIKDFVLSSYHGEEDNTHVETDSDASSRQNTGVDTNALHAKINQSPMGVEKLQIEDESVNILSAPRVTCLFPKEGNCHAFVAGPYGAAVLDVSNILMGICIQSPQVLCSKLLLISPSRSYSLLMMAMMVETARFIKLKKLCIKNPSLQEMKLTKNLISPPLHSLITFIVCLVCMAVSPHVMKPPIKTRKNHTY